LKLSLEQQKKNTKTSNRERFPDPVTVNLQKKKKCSHDSDKGTQEQLKQMPKKRRQ